jgi:hypothetical protein
MPQFMAWERSFEKRVLKIRERELRFEKLNYLIEVIYFSLCFVLMFSKQAPPPGDFLE